MEIGSNAYRGSYNGVNGRRAIVQQSGEDIVQPATQSPAAFYGIQTESSKKVPAAALASAMWQMMVRRSNDSGGERLII